MKFSPSRKERQKPKAAATLPDPEILRLYATLPDKYRDAKELSFVQGMFQTQYPALRKVSQAKIQPVKKRWSLGAIASTVLWGFAVVAGLSVILHACVAGAEVGQDNALIEQAKAAAALQQEKALATGTNFLQHDPQVVTSAAGTALVETRPSHIIRKVNGELGTSGRQTMITVIQAAPTPLPTPLPRPVIIPKQETSIKTHVDGIDRIDTQAVLPEGLDVDQLDAVKNIADNGVIIAQQRLGLEQYKIQVETSLARLQVWKSFTLWGFLASIPFLGTIFLIARSALRGYTAHHQRRLEYKLKELEASERVIYDKVSENR